MVNSLGQDSYDRQYTDAYLLRRIASYFQKQRSRLLMVAGTLVFLSLAGAMTPILVSSTVDALENQHDMNLVLLLVGAFLVTVFLQYGANWTRRRFINLLIADGISQMRKDAFAASVRRDLAFYDDNKSGKIVSRITSDTQDFAQVLVIASDIFSQFIELFILCAVLLTREWHLLLLTLLWMPVYGALALFFRRMARVVGRQGSRAMAAVNDNIQESVAGISVAKNFRREALIYDEFMEINNQSY
ncbi:MAG: ABC transporter ATP-binding protein, partial [Anaerolineae bacterium]|nr:ABC transporter ATP-binding protein [Anaerolineae bacterium]